MKCRHLRMTWRNGIHRCVRCGATEADILLRKGKQKRRK